jgi:branched-chain amino acid transport system substrate-binding protein
VRLGALIPLSADNAPTGQRLLQAYQLAIKDVNDGGGVLGRPLELVTRDDACDPGTAVAQANHIVTEGITVSVGGGCSVAAVPVLKIFHTAGIPMIIPAANSDDLLVPGYHDVFLLSGTAKAESRQAVATMSALGARRPAVVDDGTSFPHTIAEAAVTRMRETPGGPAVAAQLTLSQGATSHSRIIEAVRAKQADLVFFTGYYPEAAVLIRDLRASGYHGAIMLADAGTDPTLFRLVPKQQLEGVYGISLPLAEFEPRAAAWAARFRTAYGTEPGPFTMQGYDAVRLAANAITRAGTTDRAAVARAIAATTPKDVDLLSGQAEFDAAGTQPHPVFVLLRVQNGRFTLVRQMT